MKSLLQYCICNSHANKASKACCCCCCCCLYNRLRLCPHQRVFIGMRFRCHRKRTDRLASTLPSTVHTKVQNWENWKLWRKLDSRCMLQTHAPAIFSVIVSILMRFRPSTQKRYVRLFVNLCAFYERFQIDAFSIKTLSDLVRTGGLNASKCMRKRKTSTKCKRKRISIFVHCISIGRTELQTFSKKTNYDQSRTYNIPSPLPPKILRNLVFAFSWDDCNTQEKVRKIALQNLRGSQRALWNCYITYFFVIFLLNALGISGVCV